MRRDLPSGPDLILVPTSLELRRLEGPDPFPEGSVLALCGFGPVSAAARTAQCLAELRPRRALLVGIAGSLDAKRAPLRSVNAFARVRLDGVGAGQGAAFQPPSRLGLPQWDGGPGAPVGETLELAGGGGELLTVCSASATPGEAALRRERHPEALAEDMEGFGVALACHLAGVPLTVVRGISNLAGQREKGGWCVDEALEAARLAALAWLAQVAGARGGHRA